MIIKKSTGFTLIELLIVVAIVGILAAIAVPTYLSYTKKAYFSEVIQATAPYKLAVESCHQKNGGSLTNCGTPGSQGIPAAAGASGNVASVTVGSGGVITATSATTNFGGTAYTYILTPTVTNN